MVRQAHLTAVAGAFVIGCAVLLLVSCAGTRSETSMGQGPTEATKKDQTRPPEATAPKEARCEGTRTLKKPNMAEGLFATNDQPGCPKGGLLSGTDKHDTLAGEDGEDEIRGLGTGDFIFGGPGNDVIYGGAGRDNPLVGDEGDDVIYGGDGDDAVLIGDEGNDVIYGGPGDDIELHGDGDGQRDKLYCGEGRDSYMADRVDYVSSSCEIKLRPSKSKGVP